MCIVKWVVVGSFSGSYRSLVYMTWLAGQVVKSTPSACNKNVNKVNHKLTLSLNPLTSCQVDSGLSHLVGQVKYC